MNKNYLESHFKKIFVGIIVCTFCNQNSNNFNRKCEFIYLELYITVVDGVYFLRVLLFSLNPESDKWEVWRENSPRKGDTQEAAVWMAAATVLLS